MKKVLLFTLTLMLSITTALAGCRGGTVDEIEIDSSKTQLYVYNYDGGVGSTWLDKVITRFEAEYANEHFESGKTGVQVVPKKTKSGFESLLTTSKNAVFFAQQVYYNQLISTGKLLPITDLVTEKGANGKSIEDRLEASQQAAFKAYDGEYYVLPHYELYSGLTYDKDVFANYKLYMKDGGGWTADVNQGSKGPDGIAGTYDDGLPSSIEEFETLCTQMVKVGVIPFIYCGQYQAYSTHLLNGLWVSLTGETEFYPNFSLNSGDTEISYVSGFNGDAPVISKAKITPENGYLLSAQKGKYEALDFMNSAIKGEWFAEVNGSTSHTDTQRRFIYSLPESETRADKKPIAMLIEGTHWYNEASEVLNDSANKYPAYSERNYAAMPLPTRVDDSTECKKNTVCDSNSSFAFLSANIKNDSVALDLAKKFLKFCYTEESLQEFTTTTGVPKGLKYDLTDAQYSAMPTYFKSLWDIKSNADVVYPYSDNPLFVRHQVDFNFAQDTAMWNITGHGLPLGAIKDYGFTPKTYFAEWTNTSKLATDWANKYADSLER